MSDGRRVEPIRGRRRWASHHFYDRARDELQTLSSGASKRTIPATEVVVVTEFWRLDATAQAALVREKSVKPTELVDAAIARIESLNPQPQRGRDRDVRPREGRGDGRSRRRPV